MKNKFDSNQIWFNYETRKWDLMSNEGKLGSFDTKVDAKLAHAKLLMDENAAMLRANQTRFKN